MKDEKKDVKLPGDLDELSKGADKRTGIEEKPLCPSCQIPMIEETPESPLYCPLCYQMPMPQNKSRSFLTGFQKDLISMGMCPYCGLVIRGIGNAGHHDECKHKDIIL